MEYWLGCRRKEGEGERGSGEGGRRVSARELACLYAYIISDMFCCVCVCAALDTNNSLVKMQIFELLAGLCLYSEEGNHLAMEALADYKVMGLFCSG